MIKWIKNWVVGIIHDELNPPKVVPNSIASGGPFVQIYKLSNGYIVHKSSNQYRDDGQTAVYCATPLDVARQIVNGEALQKLNITGASTPMQTTERASGVLGANSP
jgi:hypothetical protein